MITIQVTSFGELLANLEELPENLRAEVRTELQRCVDILWNKLVNNPIIAALEAKTGWTVFERGVEQQGNLAIGYVSPTKPSSGWYDIFPPKKPFLSFIGKQDGMRVFTKHVFHPPFPMERIVEPEFAEIVPFVEKALNDAVQRATDKVNRRGRRRS